MKRFRVLFRLVNWSDEIPTAATIQKRIQKNPANSDTGIDAKNPPNFPKIPKKIIHTAAI
jgi:hypothetical protein